jgi:hypothetical protein
MIAQNHKVKLNMKNQNHRLKRAVVLFNGHCEPASQRAKQSIIPICHCERSKAIYHPHLSLRA